MGVPAQNELTKHSFCPSIMYESYYWYTDWEIDLGEPLGNYYEVSGHDDCFRREFESGIVLVNPTDVTTGWIELGGTYRTIEFQSVNQVVLGAREGLMLFPEGEWNLAALTIVDEGINNNPSAWSLEDGGRTLVQKSNIYSDGTEGLGTYAYDPSLSWRDFSASLRLSSDDDDALGVMFRYVDDNNYYRFSWDSQRSYRRLVRRKNGAFTELAEDSVPYEVGVEYLLKIVATGENLEVWVNGERIFAVADSGLTEGNLAMYCWGNVGSRFKDLSVVDLGGEDVVAPEAPAGLTVTNFQQ